TKAVAETPPATCSVLVGLVVPMPTLPLVWMLIRVAEAVLSRNSNCPGPSPLPLPVAIKFQNRPPASLIRLSQVPMVEEDSRVAAKYAEPLTCTLACVLVVQMPTFPSVVTGNRSVKVV